MTNYQTFPTAITTTVEGEDDRSEPILWPTVVDAEYFDGEQLTYIFDQAGQLRLFFSRDVHDHDTNVGADIRNLQEVADHCDQLLVDRIADSRFVDGSTPLRLLGIAHRFINALESTGGEVRTLSDIIDRFETLEEELIDTIK